MWNGVALVKEINSVLGDLGCSEMGCEEQSCHNHHHTALGWLVSWKTTEEATLGYSMGVSGREGAEAGVGCTPPSSLQLRVRREADS